MGKEFYKIGLWTSATNEILNIFARELKSLSEMSKESELSKFSTEVTKFSIFSSYVDIFWILMKTDISDGISDIFDIVEISSEMSKNTES